MTIALYINTAENNRVDKTQYLQQVIELDGTLRDASSLINPTIAFELPNLESSALIDEDNEDVVSPDDDLIMESDEFYRFNYVYINEFKRYYFVQDINIVRSHYFVVSLSVDVLMSFRDNILDLSGMIERNEYTFDPLLDDSLLPLNLEPEITEVIEGNLGRANTTFSTDFSKMTRNLVFAVVGISGERPIISGVDDLPSIDSGLFLSSGMTLFWSFASNDIGDIAYKLLVESTQYSSYYKSLVAYPFDLESEAVSELRDVQFVEFGGITEIKLGVKGKLISSQSKYRVIADFMMPEIFDFTDLSPYSHYELYIPFYGFYEMDIKVCHGDRLLVYYAINFEDGSAEVYLYDLTKHKILFSSPCQVGIPLSLSSTNAQEINTMKQSAMNNMILGVLGSTISALVGKTSGGVGVAMGTLSMAKSLVSYNNAVAQMWVKAQSTHNGSPGALYSFMDVRLRITKTRATPSDMGGFRKLYGSPLRQIRTLSSLSGFTIVSDIHLENLNAFKREKEEIERLLKSGVIL